MGHWTQSLFLIHISVWCHSQPHMITRIKHGTPSFQVNVYFILCGKNITELQFSFVFALQCSSQRFHSPFSFPAYLAVVWKIKWKLLLDFSWIQHSFNFIFHFVRLDHEKRRCFTVLLELLLSVRKNSLVCTENITVLTVQPAMLLLTCKVWLQPLCQKICHNHLYFTTESESSVCEVEQLGWQRFVACSFSFNVSSHWNCYTCHLSWCHHNFQW